MKQVMRIISIVVMFVLGGCAQEEHSAMDAERSRNDVYMAVSGVSAISGVSMIYSVENVEPPPVELINCDPARGQISNRCPVQYSTTWWKCTDSPLEIRELPTIEQQRRLVKFSVEVFSPGLGGDPFSPISRSMLISRFGQPRSEKSKETHAYDPTDPMQIETDWDFQGLRIIAVASKPKPDEMGIQEGEITGENVTLLFGVRVGQSIGEWVKQFGHPICLGSQGENKNEFTLGYEPEEETFIPCEAGSCFVNYSIRITLDATGKVKSMNWSYPML